MKTTLALRCTIAVVVVAMAADVLIASTVTLAMNARKGTKQ